jgi:hypothetical protein
MRTIWDAQLRSAEANDEQSSQINKDLESQRRSSVYAPAQSEPLSGHIKTTTELARKGAKHMQQKANPKEEQTFRAQEKVMTDMAEKAIRNYEQALKTGLKLQEEAVKCWSSLVNQGTPAQEYQKGFANLTRLANDALPIAQRRMEEVLQLVEKNSQTGTELMRKAVEAARSPVTGNGQNKWTELWTSSMGVMRSNAEALAEINSRAIDSCIDLVRRSGQLAKTHVTQA